MKKLLSPTSAIILIFFAGSCKKNIKEENLFTTVEAHQINSIITDLPSPTVHTVGSYQGIAKYRWGPGSDILSLTDGSPQAIATGIFIAEKEIADFATSPGAVDADDITFGVPSDNTKDIYISGYEINSVDNLVRRRALYWKNGVKIYLTNGARDAQANRIAVAGGDVYVVGYERNAASVWVAKYWKNGIAFNLTNGIRSGEATDVFVVERKVLSATVRDVYISGYEQNNAYNHVAKYWKNGVPVELTNGQQDARGNAIKVIGGDVYVAGDFEHDYPLPLPHSITKAAYWKNGLRFDLVYDGLLADDHMSLSTAEDIMVTGGIEKDVHVAGKIILEKISDGYTFTDAAYWKNGTSTTLARPGFAKAIAIAGDDVYIGGGNKYWRNGIPANLAAISCNDLVVEE